MAQSMWNIPDSEIVVGPVQLMREQGEILTASTYGKLTTQIQTSGNEAELVNDFNIVVPSLGYYSYTVARYAQKPLALYPGSFYSPLVGDWIPIQDEGAFKEALAKTLSSESAGNLVKTLLSQVS